MSQDDHGHDPIAEWLDRPRGEKTHRQMFAHLARAWLGLPSVAQQVTDAGLDAEQIVTALTGWTASYSESAAVAGAGRMPMGRGQMSERKEA